MPRALLILDRCARGKARDSGSSGRSSALLVLNLKLCFQDIADDTDPIQNVRTLRQRERPLDLSRNDIYNVVGLNPVSRLEH